MSMSSDFAETISNSFGVIFKSVDAILPCILAELAFAFEQGDLQQQS